MHSSNLTASPWRSCSDYKAEHGEETIYRCSTVVNCYLRTVNALKQSRAGVPTRYMQYTTGTCQVQLPRNPSCFREACPAWSQLHLKHSKDVDATRGKPTALRNQSGLGQNKGYWNTALFHRVQVVGML